MRKLLLASAAVCAATALSGCSFLGLGGHSDYGHSAKHSGYYGQQAMHHAPKSCNSSNCLSRWNLEGGLGPAFFAGGDIVNGESTNAGTGANIRNISYNDAYETGWRGELGGSYALAPNTKVTATGFYTEADSEGVVDWGTVDGQNLSGGLSDYKSYGGELGLRQYFAPRRGIILNTVRPYVEGRVGLAHVDDIRIQNARLGGAAFNGGADVPFTDSGLVGSAAGLVGVETPLTRYSTIALETGLRYTGEPKSDLTALSAGTPLAGTNNGASNLTIPVMLRGRYRF